MRQPVRRRDQWPVRAGPTGRLRTKMRPSITPRAPRLGLLAVAGLTLAVGASPLLVSGADHLDAPAAKADHRVDITDVYGFRSGPSQTTRVLNVDGLMSPTDSRTATFRTSAIYELKVD